MQEPLTKSGSATACRDASAAVTSRLLFVSGTAANVRQGSGTYVGIAVLRRALEARGAVIESAAPAHTSAGAWRRLWFNFGLRRRARHRALDGVTAVVGFDLDGVLLPHRRPRAWLDVASIKGVLAEEMQFERGWVRGRLALQAWFERRRVHQADRVLVTSQYAAEAVIRRYGADPGKLRVVPEPIELAAWQARFNTVAAAERPPVEPPLEAAWKRHEQSGRPLPPVEARPQATSGSDPGKSGEPPEPPTTSASDPAKSSEPLILCVAHLYPRKDVATLLHALAQMRQPARAHIVGDGPEFGRLQQLARQLQLGPGVEFLGHIPLAALRREYRNADIFCLPSRQEGFGIVLLEAMAAALPIVAARAAAIPEVVAEGECALLFPPGDAVALAATLDRLLGDEPARRHLGQNGQRHVLRYDAARVAEAFLNALA